MRTIFHGMSQRLYSVYIMASLSGDLDIVSTVRRQRTTPTAVKSGSSREILRAKEALQDDSALKFPTVLWIAISRWVIG